MPPPTFAWPPPETHKATGIHCLQTISSFFLKNNQICIFSAHSLHCELLFRSLGDKMKAVDKMYSLCFPTVFGRDLVRLPFNASNRALLFHCRPMRRRPRIVGKWFGWLDTDNSQGRDASQLELDTSFTCSNLEKKTQSTICNKSVDCRLVSICSRLRCKSVQFNLIVTLCARSSNPNAASSRAN